MKRKGLTLIEVIISLAIFLIIVPGVSMLLINVTRGFTSFEVANTLKKTNQETLNRIYLRLSECKRIFDNSPTGNDYSTRIDTSTVAGCPKGLSDSHLPKIEEGAIVAPGTLVSSPTSVGNSLFFATNDSAKSVFDAVNNITHTIDVYRFNYYYLTSDNPRSITDRQSYRIVEWRSVLYADYYQLMNIPLASRTETIKGLVAPPNNVVYAWNASEEVSSVAFWTLDGAGNMTPIVNPTYKIPKFQCKVLTEMITGIMGSGYKYGISPNSSVPTVWARAPKIVPQYAIAAGNFPGGFEVVIVGNPGGRKVFLRSVLVAQGAMAGILGDDQLVLCSVRDLW
ncbi:MAG: prepilin-type N-terminal cleavage/methylation domain-containing protein [Elusimicrobia bacterium]|nr:prepilin-type N-terminal cleavage/methylation domain-containing protein [Elusimicrobiota bacterium]